MATTLQEILHSVEALPDADKERLLRELLRWSALAPHPTLTDDELTAAGDEIFQLYDREERERE